MDQENYKNLVIQIAQDLLEKVGFEGTIRFYENNGDQAMSILAINSETDLSMLIGKNGQNLGAFEHLLRLLVNRKLGQINEAHLIVDVNDYRKSRENYLKEVARNIANKVVQSGKAEALLPMSSYERRLVHTELASIKDVATESIGEEPRRRIVVKPLP